MIHFFRLIAYGCIFLILSCKSSDEKNTEKKDSSPSEILKVTAKPIYKTFPEIFEAAFDESTVAEQNGVRYNFEKKDIGKIKILSGKIIATDQITMHDASAFVKEFPKGEFPVQLSVSKIGMNNVVVFVRILFTDVIVVKWEFAIQPGQIQMELKENKYFSFSVDAGTAMIIDSITLNNLRKNGFSSEILNTANFTYGRIYNFGNENLAGFTTGYGDGRYYAYIGYDEEGKICRLLADFNLFSWWK